MPSPTRRTALHVAVTASVAGLTGCTGIFSASNSGESTPEPWGTPVTTYEVRHVRFPGEQLLWREPEDTRSDGTAAYIEDQETLDGMTINDDSVASFCSATTFESESLLLRHQRINSCTRERFAELYSTASTFRALFCHELRPGDVDCAADSTVTVGIVVRLPFPGDHIEDFTTSIGRCPGKYRPSRNSVSNGTTTATGEVDER